jgi:hypothetical protein
MKASFRSGLILAGTILLYLAFLLQSQSSLPMAASIIPWPSVAISIVLSAALVYVAGGLMARGRGVSAASIAALILFLLNPLLTDPALLVTSGDRLRDAAGPLVIASAWIWMEDWSALMRSVGLAVLLACGLFSGAHSVQSIILALIVWMFFSRRPLPAMGSFAVILILSGILFQTGVLLYGLIWLHSGDPVAAWQMAVDRHQAFWDLSRWWGGWLLPRFALERADRFLLELSPAWWILVVWMCGERLVSMVKERRAGPETFLASVVVVSTVSGLLSEGSMRSELSGVLMISAAATPILAVDLTAKEVLMSRAGRITAVAGFFFSAIAALTFQVWAGVAALAAAYVFSRLVVRARWMGWRVRWMAVLGGATLGAWLAESFSLFRN